MAEAEVTIKKTEITNCCLVIVLIAHWWFSSIVRNDFSPSLSHSFIYFHFDPLFLPTL